MKFFIVILLLLPSIAIAQATAEDYSIYSKYLNDFRNEVKGTNMDLIVLDTMAWSLKFNEPSISDIVADFRKYFKGDKSKFDYEYILFRKFTEILINDTLWISRIDDLDKKTKVGFRLENYFPTDLQVKVIDKRTFNKYFKFSDKGRQVERNWARFHREYPMPSALIELSPISSDDKRAVFYFSMRCGGLCGHGDLVFFEKENNGWTCLGHFPLWYN